MFLETTKKKRLARAYLSSPTSDCSLANASLLFPSAHWCLTYASMTFGWPDPAPYPGAPGAHRLGS